MRDDDKNMKKKQKYEKKKLWFSFVQQFYDSIEWILKSIFSLSSLS